MPPKKSIEETYQKLTQREHILKRGNMYIGSPLKQTEEMWVVKNGKIEKQFVEYTPGFLKIFDEVLTNATDHAARDSTLDKIKVDYSKESGEISVMNTGTGIPVVVNKDHNMYVPELIFGHLLAGSNYDDTQQRIGAGVNGLGAKLASVYSKKFIVETIDSENGLKFVQEFTDNMEHRKNPKITKNSGKSYTKITFVPDYTRFGMNGLEEDTVKLIDKRVYDCIACTDKNVNIYLNGEKLKGKGLADYVKYYFDENSQVKTFYESSSQKIGNNEFVWEYIIVPWDKFEQISFVNGNSTYQGGRHVDHIVNQITSKIKTYLEIKKKLKEIKPGMVKDKLFLFLRATVVNPQFSSQTKEFLTTQTKDFGCRVEVTDSFITKLQKSSITEDLVELCKMKETIALAKTTDGTKKSKIYIPKLEDALWAGTAKSDQTTLILTEGDSASTFAKWGRSIIGADKYAVFPLRGKLLNVRDATVQQLMGNEEINNLKQIIGLKQGKDYKDTKELRYGKIMILTDADSVTYDTPCLLKNITTGEIEIKPIKDVNDNNWITDVSDKEYSTCDKYLTWTSNGWSKIKGVMRHKVDKNIHRVLTHTGCVDVTEDHSLITSEKNMTTALDCVVGETKLLHHRYIQQTHRDYGINEEYAYALGYFQADGSCSTDGKVKLKRKDGSIHEATNNHWSITCVEEEPLIKLKAIFEKHEKTKREIEVKEITHPNRQCTKCYHIFKNAWAYKQHMNIKQDCTDRKTTFIIRKVKVSKNSYSEKSGRNFKYMLEVRGERKDFCNKYRRMFYNDSREKIVPKEILNSSIEIQRVFLNGFYEGDGDKGDRTTDNFDGEHKSQMMGMFQLIQNCGYSPSINCSTTKLNVYKIMMSKTNLKAVDTVKKIINVTEKYKNTYVYDLETESHQFHAGIGNMIVHNCDGVHIRSLLVNLFHAFWPSLLKLNYIETLRTPIIKAIKGKKVIEFYTEQDYLKWKDQVGTTTGYHIRYFKGLGTSKKEDAHETFRNMGKLRAEYYYKDRKCDDAILLAFEKDKNVKTKVVSDDASESSETNDQLKCSDKRKQWLSNYDKNSYIQATEQKISFQDLIHKELIHFSIYDNLRSIPSLCDGLKPSQRKILYYMLKKNITKTIKVAQLSGYVSAETGYHHGEASLQQAIVNMAQTFVGSNNINLLVPDGNFGSRFQGSKDAASPRYIFTYLSDVTQNIFNPNDTQLLNFLDDDGTPIEPEWYIPVIPMVLVNGCEGIGTGYSTYIPSHNPKDVIANIYRVLDNKKPLPMKPYFNGFGGEVEELGSGSYITKGIWKRMNVSQIKITELPVGTWVTTYKEFLESLIEGNKSSQITSKRKNKVVLKDVRNETTDENTGICFVVEFKNTDDLDALIKSNTLEKELKLTKSFSTNNMYLFGIDASPARYENTVDILLDFCDVRLEYYIKRREYLINKLTHELNILESKVRFIAEYIDGTLDINKKSKAVVCEILKKRKYYAFCDNENTESDENVSDYDYLVKMPIISLTSERIEDLTQQTNRKRQQLEDIQSKDHKQLWREDLDIISRKL